MRILIAEDDPVSSRLLSANLEKWNHEVVVCESGSEALDLFERDGDFGMAILDWMMPGVEGPEVCARIKGRPDSQFTYVILLTAKIRKEDIVQALNRGADDYLTKPWDAEELRARIDAGVRIVQLERNLTQRLGELEAALAIVKKLEGFIPICSFCRKVRNDDDYWESVEAYITQKSEAQFSHSICPECLEDRYPSTDPEEHDLTTK